MAVTSALAAQVDAARRFNRFYTRQLGVLDEGLLESPFSLAECRVLYELAHRTEPSATEVGAALGLDPGYLSRILRGFERRRLVARRTPPEDRRRSLLRLTAAGRRTFETLNARSQAEVESTLRRLEPDAQRRLLESMHAIETILDPTPAARRGPPAYVLREPRPGDIGWMIHRHGVLYAEEFGWKSEFEALAARIAGRFLERFDPARERGWIAERDGAILGSVLLVRKSQKVAQLRMLLVEPAARGLGLGGRLVEECVRFARGAGYARVELWTNSLLVAARRLYERAGFRKVSEAPHRSWGHDLVSETWALDLSRPDRRVPAPTTARGSSRQIRRV